MKVYDDSWFTTHLRLAEDLLAAPAVPVETWHAQDVRGNPQLVSYELMGIKIVTSIPEDLPTTQAKFEPNLPWAEEHFQERVSGVPLNPPPSHVRWPYARKSNEEHISDEKFSHTYPERFWPKAARGEYFSIPVQDHWDVLGPVPPRAGIRYLYGDLQDVVELLAKHPLTRQAYLPVFFPEDTGAVHGERIPCTIGYQFLIREVSGTPALNVIYTIRSCDFMRHFADDVYMAVRLGQWIRSQLDYNLNMGKLIMDIGSLHIFEGDKPILRRKLGL